MKTPIRSAKAHNFIEHLIIFRIFALLTFSANIEYGKVVSKSGRYGGIYAHKDIAFKFASWISVEFELYIVKEFQRLKQEEQKLIGWTAKRELSKINYHIHTDAIK